MKRALALALAIPLAGSICVAALLFDLHHHRRLEEFRPGSASVEVMSGTGGYPLISGMLSPAVSSPFGFVRIGPDTGYSPSSWFNWQLVFGNMATSGYYWGHTHVLGFSHWRLQGTGLREGGHFRFMPSMQNQYQADVLDHSNEMASADLYRLTLPRDDIEVQLTAHQDLSAQRYKFNKNGERYIFVAADSAIGRAARTKDAALTYERNLLRAQSTVVGDASKEFEGVTLSLSSVFTPAPSGFTCVLERASNCLQARLQFNQDTDQIEIESILSKSHTPFAPKGSFQETQQRNRRAWNNSLGLIKASFTDKASSRQFYTALFRLLQSPGLTKDGPTELSMWDTYRTAFPLLALFVPAKYEQMVEHLLDSYRSKGTLPSWQLFGNDVDIMSGLPASIFLSEALQKNLLKSKDAFFSIAADLVDGKLDRYDCLAAFRTLGYCPSDSTNASVSKSLELAWAFDSISRAAKSFGRGDIASRTKNLSDNYKELWNEEHKLFIPKTSLGSWQTGPYPYSAIGRLILLPHYIEGSAEQWRWGIPFAADELVNLMGKDMFVQELQDFLNGVEDRRGRMIPSMNYWHGNEPSIHAAYLFNHAGRPDLAQKWVRRLLASQYALDPSGYDGNDDGGTLSAWYILSSLGIYPQAGSNKFWFGSPLVRKAEIDLGNGRTLRIEAKDQGPESVYVDKVLWNNERVCQPEITHNQLIEGGRLEFFLNSTANPATFACE